MNGNKEYYETIRDITMYNRKKMRDLYNAGIRALKRFHSNIEDKENNNRYWENPKYHGNIQEVNRNWSLAWISFKS